MLSIDMGAAASRAPPHPAAATRQLQAPVACHPAPVVILPRAPAYRLTTGACTRSALSYNPRSFMKWRIPIFAAVLLAAPALSAAEQVDPKKIEFLDLLAAGGIMMYPLAFLSIATVVLVFLYAFTIRRNTVVSDRFMNAAEAMIRKRDFLGLIAYCHRQNECMARITQRTLDFFSKNTSVSFSEIREVAQAEGSRQASMLSQRITYLADIGSIAPMFGLLGTVLGMIKSFLEISVGNFEGVRQMQLASGVSEALITTAAGLVIGIPALIFYSLFRGRVQKFISELEAASTHLLAILNTQLQRTAVRQPQAPPPSRGQRHDLLTPVPTNPLEDERPDLQGI
jgi:biopolymer transport protein ExbB